MNSTSLDEKRNEGIVYLAKNNKNGKLYVGITTRPLKDRISEHKYDSFNRKSSNKSYFHNAIKLYGFDKFSFKVIETVHANTLTDLTECLYSLERYYIEKYQTNDRNKGYNLTIGGEGISGYRLSPEHKAIVSKTHKGKHLSQEHKERISEFMRSSNNPRLGKHLSAETRKKISDSHKGLLLGEKNPMYGRKRPDVSLRNVERGYKVRQIIPRTGEIIHCWDSLRAASKGTGYSRSCIADCCNHKTKLSHGYIWEYEMNSTENKEEM